MSCVQKNITWYSKNVEYCMIRLWLSSHLIYTDDVKLFLITWCNVRTIFAKNNWIDTFQNILFANEQTNQNHIGWFARQYQCIYVSANFCTKYFCNRTEISKEQHNNECFTIMVCTSVNIIDCFETLYIRKKIVTFFVNSLMCMKFITRYPFKYGF